MKASGSAVMRLTAFWALLVFGVSFPPLASATFPSIEIALWDPHFAKEDRSNPDYLEIFKLVDEKQLDQALEKAETLIKKTPEKGTPVILKALLLYEKRKFHEAFLTLQRGRVIQPRHPAIHYANCQIYRQIGAVFLAKRACVIAVQQHPKQPEAYFEKATTHTAAGEVQDAIRDLKEAIRLDPKNPEYPFHLGKALLYLNKQEEAVTALKNTLKLDPGHLEAAFQLGHIYASQRNIEEAERYLNQVYDTRQNNPLVETARIIMENIKGDDFPPPPVVADPALYHKSRSQNLYRAGDYGLSLFEIQTAARLAPQDLPIQQINIGMTSLFLRLEEAEEAVRHFIEITPTLPEMQAKGYQELGDIALILGRLEEARQHFSKAVKLGDPDGIAKTSLGELPSPGTIAPIKGNPNEWLIDPIEGLNRKGEIFTHYRMFERALAIYSLALRMSPNSLTTKLNTGNAYLQSGQLNRAIAILEKALITHPAHPDLFFHRVLLAKAYAAQKDTAEAVKNLQLAKEQDPNLFQKLKFDPALASLKDHPVFQ